MRPALNVFLPQGNRARDVRGDEQNSILTPRLNLSDKIDQSETINIREISWHSSL